MGRKDNCKSGFVLWTEEAQYWIPGLKVRNTFKLASLKNWSFCEGFIALFYYRKGSWQTRMLQPLTEIEI